MFPENDLVRGAGDHGRRRHGELRHDHPNVGKARSQVGNDRLRGTRPEHLVQVGLGTEDGRGAQQMEGVVDEFTLHQHDGQNERIRHVEGCRHLMVSERDDACVRAASPDLDEAKAPDCGDPALDASAPDVRCRRNLGDMPRRLRILGLLARLALPPGVPHGMVYEMSDARQALPRAARRHRADMGRAPSGGDGGDRQQIGESTSGSRRGSAASGRQALAPTSERLAVEGHGSPVADSAFGPHGPGSAVHRSCHALPSRPKEPPLLETTSEWHIPGGVSPRGPGGSRIRWRRTRWNHDHR